MSSDYRPRGGSSSGGSSSGGPRRRRGGRNRSRSGNHGEHRSGEARSHTNGHASGPAKKENIIDKFVGWLTGKGKKAPAKSSTPRSHAAPPTEHAERAPRAPRPERAERPRRTETKEEPVMHEITTPKLYVGNLAYEAAESDLFDLFSKIGAVKNVEVAMDRRSNRSKGFGFVEMETLETAKEASAQLNRTDFMGRQIVVSGAKMDRQSVNRRDEEPASEAAPEANPETQL
jgi:hypothetical protein